MDNSECVFAGGVTDSIDYVSRSSQLTTTKLVNLVLVVQFT